MSIQELALKAKKSKDYKDIEALITALKSSGAYAKFKQRLSFLSPKTVDLKFKQAVIKTLLSWDPSRASFTTALFGNIERSKNIVDTYTSLQGITGQQRSLLQQIEEFTNEFLIKYNRPPTIEELASHFGTTPERIRNLVLNVRKIEPSTIEQSKYTFTRMSPVARLELIKNIPNLPPETQLTVKLLDLYINHNIRNEKKLKSLTNAPLTLIRQVVSECKKVGV